MFEKEKKDQFGRKVMASLMTSVFKDKESDPLNKFGCIFNATVKVFITE